MNMSISKYMFFFVLGMAVLSKFGPIFGKKLSKL
jgi:hypothetical protein